MSDRMNHVNWARIVRGNPYKRPEPLDHRALAKLSDVAKANYDDRRARWHANFGVIKTPQLVTAHEQLDEILAANRHVGDRVRGAAVVDAPPGLGKTTIANTYALRYWAKEMRRGLPEDDRYDRIPVIKVGLKANVTTKWLTERMCRFMGLPTTGTESAMHDRLFDAVEACETGLIVIDEIQFLNFAGKKGREVHNHIKFLANEFPTTFLFVGHSIRKVNARSSVAIQDAARQQTDSRWTYVDVNPFAITTDEAKAQWRSFLLTIESKLVLSRLQPGILADDLSDYIWSRTSGRMQHITSLIVRGCARAIRSGDERLTRELLDQVKLERSAEFSREERAYGADHGVYERGRRIARQRTAAPTKPAGGGGKGPADRTSRAGETVNPHHASSTAAKQD